MACKSHTSSVHRNSVLRELTQNITTVKQYPYATLPTLLLVLLLLYTIFSAVLRLLGFGPSGPVGGKTYPFLPRFLPDAHSIEGSAAARYQSRSYGGNIPRGSTFATLQKAGMKSNAGTTNSIFLTSIGVLVGIIGIYALLRTTRA